MVGCRQVSKHDAITLIDAPVHGVPIENCWHIPDATSSFLFETYCEDCGLQRRPIAASDTAHDIHYGRNEDADSENAERGSEDYFEHRIDSDRSRDASP